MDVVDFMLTRRSPKAETLADPAPDTAQLETILRAATRVPDHGRLAPWRIQVVHKPGQAKLGELVERLYKADNPDTNDRQLEFERNRLQRAPLLLVVTLKPVESRKIPQVEQLLSAGAVCYGIVITAGGMGFGAQWLTEWPAFRPEVVEALGHDPETDRIVGFVYLGTSSEAPKERQRPNLDDVCSDWAGE
ncbi:MAG: nitroreductase [Rhodospirillaceae bacterium]|nr:nitroreductase [Rhodospirillaceae bacterium]